MMGAILEVKATDMILIFKSKKTKERERRDAKVDKQIEELKEKNIEKAQAATDAITELNNLVDKHGISGLIYFSTGKGRKK